MPAANPGERGFTLFELLVVIAIMGVMLVLIGLGARPVSASMHARNAAMEISQALRATRSAALMSNHSVDFALDLTPPAYQSGVGPRRLLPGDVKLALMTGRDQLISDDRGRIRFDPDGGSSGGRISILGAGQLWTVGVDWLSGRISVVHDAH